MSAGFVKALSVWLKAVPLADGTALPDISVYGVCQDSRLCESNEAYLALAGKTTHGYLFAKAATERGASVVLVSPLVAQDHPDVTAELNALAVPVVLVPDLDEHAAALAAEFYDHPAQQMNVIAVTGTDGKTSVCRFIQQALTQQGIVCGYIGTLGWGTSAENSQETALTTPDSVVLQKMLATMLQQGAKAVALEASSHGIAEGRLNAIEIRVAVLTNLGRDHLDYHESEEAYAQAKAQLFRWPSLTSVVLNANDNLGQLLIDELASVSSVQVHTYGTRARYTASHVVLGNAGLSFEIDDDGQRHEIVSSFYGRFNVENLCACYGVLRACGLSTENSADALQTLGRVPGRMEPFKVFAQPTVIVDYAHTPQALTAAIQAVREHTQGDVWVVFGCGGDRDPGKRALMAQAAEAADHIIVTDDNPRSENPSHIRLMVINGLSSPSSALEIGDRERAIQYAIWHAQPDDVVLVAGKGHESVQIVGNDVLNFSDRDAVQRLLQEAS